MNSLYQSLSRVACVVLLWVGGLCCQTMASTMSTPVGDYNPPTPPDPQQPDETPHYLLSTEVSPRRAGSVNIESARYAAGARFWLQAYAKMGYRFVQWTLEGEVVSTEAYYEVEMPDRDAHYVATFVYDPSAPDDPSSAEQSFASMHQLTVSCSPQRAGSLNVVSGRYAEGSSVYIAAYPKTGYRFSYWLENGNLLSTKSSIDWQMGKTDTHLEAVFAYAPAMPDDPESDERDTEAPLLQEVTLALRSTEQWNQPGHPQEIIVSGKYYGAEASTLQYSLDGSEWQDLAGELLQGNDVFERSFSAVVLPQGDARPTHTLQVRAFDSAQRASQPFVQQILYLPALTPVGLGDLVYTGSAVTHRSVGVLEPASGRYLWSGEEQLAVVYQNNVNAGEAQAEMTGCFPYSIASVQHSFQIQPASISGEVGLSQSVYVYDGKAHKPDVTFVSQGRILTEGIDYTIDYANNVEVGQGQVNVNGMGNYKDAETKNFKICATDAVWQQLVAFYQAMHGDQTWVNGWNVGLGAQASANLFGVTFKQGQVASIKLPSNGLTGVLPSAITAFRYLTELDLHGNRLTGLAEMLPASITEVDLSGQEIDEVFALRLEDLTPEKLRQAVPQISLYDHEARNYQGLLQLQLTDSPSRPSWVMNYEAGSEALRVSVEPGLNIYRGAQNATVYATNLYDESSFRIELSWLEGDANMDSHLALTDLQTMVNYINQLHAPSAPFCYSAANRWPDYTLNVQDIVAEVNLLLAQSTSAPARSALRGEDSNDADVSLYLHDGALCLYSRQLVAALDLTYLSAGELAWEIESAGFAVGTVTQDGQCRSILFSATGAVLPAGTEVVLARSVSHDEPSLCSVEAVEANACALTAAIQQPTAIESLPVVAEEQRQSYYLDGRPAAADAKGFVIRNNRIIRMK